MSSLSKLDSLMRVLLLAQQDRAGNADDLARTLGVAKRTAHRYIQALRSIGVPIHFDPDAGRYRISREFFLPPIQLTASEALALTALVEQVAGREQVPLTKPASLAIEKIRGRLSDRLLRELDETHARPEIRLAASSDAEASLLSDVYDAVTGAIRTRRKLRCLYDSAGKAGDEAEWFVFQPYRVWFEQRAWYAVGRHERHGVVRCLKLNRFSAFEGTDEPYVIPDDFSLDDYLGDAWRMIRGDRVHDVAIRFEPRMADTVSDTRWHDTQEIDYHDDGSIVFRCRVAGLDEICYWVLSYGPGARVIEPPELARRIAEMARATAARYADESGHDTALSP